ncbi:MAG: class I SAM-dependent methyltransferase [Zhongshania sp.]|uniref:class I SAM-dependent methyltransferase n=1 Tax=Zhongshania sp. TaxID=1971902 RepID=UPI002603082C|nr:class I SAM-dependent methyltransferase [Zhongshania sp.]MDF1691154.1 class I SAM-dependent methyltransferase [Zhongshania sp.]
MSEGDLELSSIVPWGRSYAEYCRMFALSERDLEGHILGCGDGPASFNAELSQNGGRIMSVDPIYQFTKAEISGRIQRVYPGMIAELARHADKYYWSSFKDPGHLGSVRMSAMNRFLDDFEAGLAAGRYVETSLPELPFFDNEFDLGLCSHLLFLYSEQIDAAQHIQALTEMCRVAKEVRVYPLLSLDGRLSQHLPGVMRYFNERDYQAELKAVPYQFQKGASDMLTLRKIIC